MAKKKKSAWKPTPKQKAALDYVRGHEWRYSVSALAKAIKVTRQAYYAWFDTAGFCDWWEKEWKHFFASTMPRVWAKVLARALGETSADDMKGGSPRDAKLLAERFDQGYIPTQKHKLTGAEEDEPIHINFITPPDADE